MSEEELKPLYLKLFPKLTYRQIAKEAFGVRRDDIESQVNRNEQKIKFILPIFGLPEPCATISIEYEKRERAGLNRENDILNASCFGVDRKQYEKMEEWLSTMPYCNMSVMDLISIGNTGLDGSLAGEKFRKSLFSAQDEFFSKPNPDFYFGGMSPFKTTSSSLLFMQSMLQWRQEKERECKDDYQKHWRQNEAVRKRLRGWLAITVPASHRTS